MNPVIKKHLKINKNFTNKFVVLLGKGLSQELTDFLLLCKEHDINPFFSFYLQTIDHSDYFQKIIIDAYCCAICKKIIMLCHKQGSETTYHYFIQHGFQLSGNIFGRFHDKGNQTIISQHYPYLKNLLLFENIKHPQNTLSLYSRAIHDDITQHISLFDTETLFSTLTKITEDNLLYRTPRNRKYYYERIAKNFFNTIANTFILGHSIFTLPAYYLNYTLNHSVLWKHISESVIKDMAKSPMQHTGFYCYLIKDLFDNNSINNLNDFFATTQISYNTFNQYILSPGIAAYLSHNNCDYSLKILSNIVKYNQAHNNTLHVLNDYIQPKSKISMFARISLYNGTAKEECQLLYSLGLRLNSMDFLNIIKSEDLYKDHFILSLVNIFFDKPQHYSLFTDIKDFIIFTENRNQNYNINRMLSFLDINTFKQHEYNELFRFIKACYDKKEDNSLYQPYRIYAESCIMHLIKKESLRFDQDSLNLYDQIDLPPLVVCCENFLAYINTFIKFSDYHKSIINSPLILNVESPSNFLYQYFNLSYNYYSHNIHSLEKILNNITINPFHIKQNSSFGHELLCWLNNKPEYLFESESIFSEFLNKCLSFEQDKNIIFTLPEQLFNRNIEIQNIYQKFLIKLQMDKIVKTQKVNRL